jgi:enoyl-CoA hydratase/carnithine racemase
VSASDAGSGLLVEAGAGVLSLTLDTPARRNAQTPALWRELARVGAEVADDVRVVVVRGNGPSFSAGLDRRMLVPGGIEGEPDLLTLAASATAAGDLDGLIAGFQSGFSWLRDPRFVSVAVVQGHAVGAGFQLALACDLRLVADDAQLAMREPSLGLVPDLGGTQPLVEAIGYSRALELCASGRWMAAAEAVRTGLALRAVPLEELAAAADELVQSLLVAPKGAVSETKALLLGASARTYDEQLAAERAAQTRRLAELARMIASAQG